MKVSVITVAYNSGESIRRLVETAVLDGDKHDIDLYLFLHSQHAPTVYTCESIKDKYPIHYYPYGVNRGIAKSWNDGLLTAYEKGSDVTIVCGDDVYFSPGDIDKLARKAVGCRDNYIISCAGFHLGLNQHRSTEGYSCFALNPIALEVIGCFDHNFFPAYGEDLDYHRRATLADLVEENCADTMIYHQGSATIANDEMLSLQNMVTQGNNGKYFIAKWGSEKLDEGYKIPFNNPNFNLYISPDKREQPYGPPYDRLGEYQLFMAREFRKTKGL